MKNIISLKTELITCNEELKVLCEQNSKNFKKGCTGFNGSKINNLIRRIENIQININQLNQKL